MNKIGARSKQQNIRYVINIGTLHINILMCRYVYKHLQRYSRNYHVDVLDYDVWLSFHTLGM